MLDTASNVIVLDADTLAGLRERKLIREHEITVPLNPIGPGEIEIGNLNSYERAVYVEMVIIRAEADELQRDAQATVYEKLAETMRSSDTPEDFHDRISKGVEVFSTIEEAEEYFRVLNNLEYLRALYTNSIRERFGYGINFGVRVGFRVVRTGYKYLIPGTIK